MLDERIDDALASANACRAKANWDMSDLQNQWLVLAAEWVALADQWRRDKEVEAKSSLDHSQQSKSLS